MTHEAAVAAHNILTDGLGRNTAVAQPLRHADSPLAAMNYHAIASHEMELYPYLAEQAPGSHQQPTPRVKRAVVHYFRRVLYNENA